MNTSFASTSSFFWSSPCMAVHGEHTCACLSRAASESKVIPAHLLTPPCRVCLPAPPAQHRDTLPYGRQ